ncbi:MAG: SRPBCC domain-containing protein [Myxococcales bacterium]|nr:SRPBCC domain-containing protein [Myxococcales bacterium]
MTASAHRAPRAVADVSGGTILASVEIAAAPERVFRALTTDEITRWWGSPDLYRTTEWVGDLRPGGRWKSTGVGADGKPFSVEGEFLEVDPPRKLVQTWRPGWDPGAATKITYSLEPVSGGTRLTLRHEGFTGREESCRGHGQGWERVLGWLDRHLSPPAQEQGERFFFCRLLPPRPSFMADMSDAERDVMMKHGAYWRELAQKGHAIVFGPVADPKGGWGLGVIRAADEAQMHALRDHDPAILSGRGFQYEILPMVRAVLPG